MGRTPISALALLLADARLPTGTHAHSSGAEQAVDDGLVHDVAGLDALLQSRLQSSVRVEAHVAAIACDLARQKALGSALEDLEDAIDARTPSPAARAVSRRQGDRYRRAAERAVGAGAFQALDRCRPPGPHLPVAIGVAAASAGLGPGEAATISAYGSIASSASATLRLLGLDPYEVSATLAGLTGSIERLATEAEQACRGGVDGLPAPAAPVLDWLVEVHAQRSDRNFAS